MVAPSVAGTLITPIAPHSLSFRPVVVPESSEIVVQIPLSARSHARYTPTLGYLTLPTHPSRHIRLTNEAFSSGF